ncbi:hypothetical protein HMPREF1624_01142 [Sporothrix schenckii ATCC 58251]|uniref:Phospholipid metabolism enzyme regulator n=1 Tax=Sporothrix schenckii (strain ATCC 58251 / de Perez 2211183) TaxID=1391915 RepID=U7Q4L8_SPOS1|nr:hypothetical protein HMPREF1624_01142 [Sporothrix schenckii ATCC 58251]
MDRSSNAVNGASANQAHIPRPTPVRESSATSMRRLDLAQPTKQMTQASPSVSAGTSASASPFASREPSPARPSARSHSAMKVATAAATSAAPTPAQPSPAPLTSSKQSPQPSTSATPTTRSRRNSQQETSPSRSRTSKPAAATQKAATLASSTIPTLLPTASDAPTARAPGPQKSEQPRDNPRWPVSPRLRSPPPVLNRPNLPASATTSDIPSINLQRTSAASPSLDAAPTPSDSEAEDLYLQPGMRTPVRGVSGNVPTLETVQEASPLAGSSRAVDAAMEKLEVASVTSDAGTTTTMPEVAEVSPARTIRARQLASQNYESGSENGSTKNNRRTAASGSAPPSLASRNSSTVKLSGKGKSGEASQPTMTVETETVTSIPNVALGPSAAQGPNGSLRTKPSSETIRPKKEKKKTVRKQSTVAPGTATSKADIFEAKVASAVDEANTSDSEETFVYDSNPAESRDRPHRFHHSRTPSATSLANNQNGMRSIHSILEGAGPSAAVKKGMKFVNTFGSGSGNDSGVGGDDETNMATIRGVTPGSGRGTARLHHHVGASGSHIGRWGLNGPKNGHQSILDSESPFPVQSGSRLKTSVSGAANGATLRQAGGASSPRPSGGSGRGNGGAFSQKRGFGNGTFGYDMDDTTPGQADDERTPLISSSVRGPGRASRSRRNHMSLRSLEQQSYQHPAPSFLNRFASCLVLTVMLMLVISGAIGFMFATSQPLEDIELVKISSVLASEQELMFDLMVRAHNPNVVVVSVDSADMEVFAKSPHAGTDSEWWRRPHPDDHSVHTNDARGDDSDNSTDLGVLDNEPRDQPDSSPNFLLGKFTKFDNPLSFEGSFFHHGLSTSRSGVRITRPGNGTDGGSERWERILDDEFDLIIKGVLRYSLPLSQRVRSALIEGRVKVKPNAAEDPSHPPNGTATISQAN